MRIAIVGCGVVGGNLAAVFEEKTNYKIIRYDPDKGFVGDISDADIVFICINDEDYNFAKLKSVADYVCNENKNGLIVIRTTVIPGTTDNFISKYNRKFVFMPEFLREKTAWEDTVDPDKLVIGTHERSSAELLVLLFSFYSGVEILVMKPIEAELAKIALNSLGVVKVIFANELYEIANTCGVDYKQLYKVFETDQNICERHLNPTHDGYRGASGKCLPKDVGFLIETAKTKKVNSKLLKLARKINNELLESRGSDG